MYLCLMKYVIYLIYNDEILLWPIVPRLSVFPGRRFLPVRTDL